MPIRVRLGLSFAAVTLVLVAVGGLLFVHSFRNGLESSLEPGLTGRAAILKSSVGTGDPIARQGGDEVAQVLDRAGHVVATTREAGDRPLVEQSTLRAASRKPVVVNTNVGNEHEPYRVLATPVSTVDGRRIVIVATSLEPTNEAVDRVRRALVVGGAIAVTLAAIGGWLLARAALRPVERLRGEAAVIGEHDSEARLRVPSTHDEIAALASTMNGLLETLHGSLIRQRALVADAGHELRTPLGVLRTELELARRPQRTRAELEDAIEHAAAETDRLVQLTEEILLLAHCEEQPGTTTASEALLPTLEQSVACTRTRAAERVVEIALEGDASVRAPIAPALLRRAIDNLLDNAIRYSPEHGRVTVKLRRDNGDAVIEVGDEGPGFPTEFLPHAFERFRRADDARSRAHGGSGLGLAIVLAVARSHCGSAEAANHGPHGAVVTVRIPEEM